MVKTLAKLGVSIEETLAFTSPIYLMELLMTARHFAQSPDLYASIHISNPKTQQVTEAFISAAQQLRDSLADGDQKAFASIYDDVRTFFGPFTDRALAQSSFVIDRVVERT